ncbi:MAG: FecR family protein [Elusimicrobiota bacterium]|nr:FecR family protein [Elusimicrobiota bacterium]
MFKILLAVSVLALPAAAQEDKGDARLDKVAGAVSIVPAGSTKGVRAKGGEALLYGDAVRTGPGAVAQVVLQDRGAVLIHENTYFTLAGTPRRTMLSFARGEFLIGLKKKLERGMSFRVRTPAAVAAVRGTLFWGKSDKEKTTTYAGFGHRIEVTALGKTVPVEAGQTVTIPFGQPPSDPKPHAIPLSYTERFHVDGGLQGLEALVDLPKPPPAAE